MEKTGFNKGWICYPTADEEKAVPVTLPHDAMLWDERIPQCPGGTNTGWYNAKDYTYEKTFQITDRKKGSRIIFEFEGAYKDAAVYINGKKAAEHEYGYTGFYVDATELLLVDQENRIRVDVKNSDQPNSRWYTGTGLYRPVWMYVLPEKHILLDGIKVTTLDYRKGRVQIRVQTEGEGKLKIQILNGATVVAEAEDICTGMYTGTLDIPDRKLWSEDSPKLYTCRVIFEEDVQEVRFGIRMIECTPEKGFCINGERVILRGACIHHDNGILGACAYPFAERRKIKILKENGYNAVRSAHNPCSKALLDACDELGMMVMDEYADMWYIHKTKYDYASSIMENYRQDLETIIKKDYNHPSVIMYSTGNEVSETAQKKGIRFCKTLTGILHELDGTRPVTCGVNIFFNFLSSMGFGVYSDKKADQAAENAKKKKAVGSEFFNTIAGVFGAGFMKTGATLYPCDLKTRDAFANMDVAGYNYGIKRYRHDLKKYPSRLILGSETFCSDASIFWKMAKKEPRLIGDFVWAGMDYLGEVGIGAWEYKDYAPDFDHGCGWVSAGAGRIDLTGKPLPEMSYTKVAFEQEKIGIGVVPVNHTKDRHSSSAWKMSNAVESWSWNGCDGVDAAVEVYARGAFAELFINGKKVGKKHLNSSCRVTFYTKYQRGKLKAVAYDKQGQVIARKEIHTAGQETILSMIPEQKTINRENDLCYVRLKYTDRNGIVKPLVKGEIRLKVEGGDLLGFGSACPYYEKSYLTDRADTYFGEALAVIRPHIDTETIVISGMSPYGDARTEVRTEV